MTLPYTAINVGVMAASQYLFNTDYSYELTDRALSTIPGAPRTLEKNLLCDAKPTEFGKGLHAVVGVAVGRLATSLLYATVLKSKDNSLLLKED